MPPVFHCNTPVLPTFTIRGFAVREGALDGKPDGSDGGADGPDGPDDGPDGPDGGADGPDGGSEGGGNGAQNASEGGLDSLHVHAGQIPIRLPIVVKPQLFGGELHANGVQAPDGGGDEGGSDGGEGSDGGGGNDTSHAGLAETSPISNTH